MIPYLMMASLQEDENDPKDVDHSPFSSQLADFLDVENYEYPQQNERTDVKNNRFSCFEDTKESTSNNASPSVASNSAASDKINLSVFHRRMSTESIADNDNINSRRDSQQAEAQNTEYVYLNRLPGENLGMVLGIEGDQENRQTIDAVVVKSVTPIGAVARSCQGTNRILVGDEIREIDGRPLNQLTHDDCIAFFQEMPDNVVLTIFRKDTSNSIDQEPSTSLSTPQAVKRKGGPMAPPRKRYVYSETHTIDQNQDVEEGSRFSQRHTDVSYSGGEIQADINEHNVPKGFRTVDVTISRREGDNFGLSIVPSYGSTCDLYQIKRLLHSGASAQSGLLEVGDRLLACNDQSLKGLTQSQCLNILKSSGAFIKLTVLRHTDSRDYTQSAVDATSPVSHRPLRQTYSSDSTGVPVAQERINKLPCGKDSADVTVAQEGSNKLSCVKYSADVTVAQEGSNELPCVNNSAGITITEAVLGESGNLLCVNDSTDFTIARDTGDLRDKLSSSNDSGSNSVSHGTDPTDFTIAQDTGESSKLFTVNDSANDTITWDVNERNEELSRDIPEAPTYKETVNGTHIQENILTNYSESENTTFIDNIDSFQFFETENTISNKKSILGEKESVVFSDIPPPGEFSDAKFLNDSDLLKNETATNAVASSVDDLLFGFTDLDPHLTNTEVCDDVLASTNYQTDNNHQDLILLDKRSGFDTSVAKLNNSHTVFTDDSAFGGQSIEEFADECFSGINNTVIEKLSSYTLKQSSENLSPDIANLQTQDEEELVSLGDPGDEVACLHDSFLKENDLKSPLFDFFEHENENFHENDNVLVSTGSTIHQTFNTSPTENSHFGDSKSYNDNDVNDWNVVKEETFSPVLNIEQHSSSVVQNTFEEISATTSPPSSAPVGDSNPFLVGEKIHWNDPTVNKAVEVRHISELGERGKVSESRVITYKAGTLPDNSSEQIIEKPPDESRLFSKGNKTKMDELHSAISTSTTNPTWSVPNNNRINADISKDERISTLHTFEKKENVLDALDSWTSEISSNNAAAFQNEVSGILDTQRKSDQPPLPENALVHTTVGVSNDGQEENIITPMICAKDHQGWQFCIPALNSQQNNQDENNVPDFRARLEIANVISSIVSRQPATSQSQKNAEESEKVVREEAIVPTLLSIDQKHIVENTLDAWVNGDASSSKPSTIQRAVLGFKTSQRHANVDNTSLHSAKSYEAEPVSEKDSDRSQISNADLHASTVETESLSKLSATENIQSIPKPEDSVKKSTEAIYESVDTKLTQIQPEVKERAVVLNTSDNSTTESSAHPTSDHVVLRKTLRQSADFNAQVDKREPATDGGSSFVNKRPRSMIVTSSNSTSRFEDSQKSYTTENKPAQTFRPLSALRPLSSSSATLFHHGNTSLHRPASASFSSSTFANKISRSDYPKVRQEDGSPFQVDIIKGIAGLGLKVKVTPEGRIQVTEVTRGGPVDKDSHIRVGDYILFINSTELTGQTDARVQQILRLLPRGLTKLVVTSAAPASSESHLKNFNSSSGSSLPSSQSHQAEVLQSTRSLTKDDSLKVTSSQKKSPLTKTEDVFSSQSVNPITNKTDSILAVSEDRVSEETELKPQSVSALDNTSSAVSYNNDKFAAGVQEQESPNLTKETNVIVNANIILNEQDSTELHVLNTEPVPLNRKSLEEKSIIRKTQSDNKINRELSNKNVEIQNTENSFYSNASSELAYESNTVPSNNQDSSAIHSSLARPNLTHHQDIEGPEKKTAERETSVSEEKLNSIKPLPFKVPPPVAPKPHLSPASMKGTEDTVDGSLPIWPPLRKTVADHTQQPDRKVTNQADGDKASSFVSSAARMFDDKTAGSHSALNKTVTRQVSKERLAHPDSGRTINASFLPTQDRHTSKLESTVSLSQSSILSRPRTLNYTSTTSSEIHVEDRATKSSENVDYKSNSVLSSTQLNSALSPRKKSSTDSPTSPPFTILKRHAPTLKDESLGPLGSGLHPNIHQGTLDSGVGHTIHKSGIYQKTPLAYLTNKSPSLVSSTDKSASDSDQVVRSTNREQHIKPVASPVSPPLSTREDAMKQFDLLLDDEVSSGTQHTSQTDESTKHFDIHTAHINKPVALPRRKLEHKLDELNVETKTNKELSEVKSKEETDQTQNRQILEDIKVRQQQFIVGKSDTVSMTPKTDSLSEDTYTITIAEKINESNRESLQTFSSDITETVEASTMAENEIKPANSIVEITNGEHETDTCIKSDITDKFEQLLQLDNGTADTNVLTLHQLSDQVEERTVGSELISQGFGQQSITRSMNNEANGINTDTESKVKEVQSEFLEAYANQIVEDLMTRIMNSPGLSKVETTQTREISVYTGHSEEEPPPLPVKEPPIPTSLPDSLQNTDLLINTDDFMNKPELNEKVNIFPDIEMQYESMYVNVQHSLPKPATAELNTNNESTFMIIQSEISDENKTVIVDSKNPLNLSNSNSYIVDDTDLNLTMSLDLLSEDSGMLADEDQEIATDDAISPLSESVENASHQLKSMPLSLKNDAELVSAYDNLVTDSGRDPRISTIDLLGDQKYDIYGRRVSQNDFYHDTVHPVLSPTTSIRVTAQHSRTNHAEDLLNWEDVGKVTGHRRETESARPVPTPRSKSLETQIPDKQNIINKIEFDDFIDAAPQYDEERMITDKQPLIVEKAQFLNEGPACSDETRPPQNKVQPFSVEIPLLPDEASPFTDEAPPLPTDAPPLPTEAPPLSDQLPLLLPDKQTRFTNQEPFLLNQISPLIDEIQTVPDQVPQIHEYELPLSEQMKQPSSQTSSFLEQAQTVQYQEQPLLLQTELSSDPVSSPTNQRSSLPDQTTSLLDEVNVKETILFLEEIKESSPDKPPGVVHETPEKILAKTEKTTDREDKVTVEKYKVNGGQEANSGAQLKPSKESIPPSKEHLSTVESKSFVSSSPELASGMHKVVMMKGATGVGFCIEGGVGSPKGDMPIIIKRIFKGGPAEKCGQLKVGDEILEVNGAKFHSMRHYEAWNHLKFLDDGAIQITLRRPLS